jgi:SAM-dependent methyltransferase
MDEVAGGAGGGVRGAPSAEVRALGRENDYKFYLGKRLFRRAFDAYAVPHLAGRVLDVGAGSAPFAHRLRADRYVALERETRFRPAVVGSADCLPFAGASFQGAICTEVLEHLPDPRRCLREIARILAPGGHLYVTAPMLWSLHYEPHDYYRFTGHGLRHLAEEAGFTVLAVEPLGGLLSFVSMRLCEKLFNLARKLGFFLPRRHRALWAACFVVPLAAGLGAVASLVERGKRRDVFDWVLLARKEDPKP